MNLYANKNRSTKETKLSPTENNKEKQRVEHNQSVLEASTNTNEKGKEIKGIHNTKSR
jgi:hypothetical protein